MVKTLIGQQVPGTVKSHVFWMGVHWIQSMRALTVMKRFMEMMMNQMNLRTQPSEMRRIVMAKAVLLQTAASVDKDPPMFAGSGIFLSFSKPMSQTCLP